MNALRPGPEAIFEITEPRAKLVGFIVVDSTHLGPAFGGVRIRAYPEERDALLDAMALAATMTLKAALAGLNCGGGKIVLIDHPELDRRRAMAVLGRALEDLGGRFFAGSDYGMRSEDLVRLRRTTQFAADESPRGLGDLGDATARGTLAALAAALAHAGAAPSRAGTARARAGQAHPAGSYPAILRGARVAVQGAGTVGMSIVRRLVAAGGVVIAADPDPACAQRAAGAGARIVLPARLATVAADAFVPAAAGSLLDEAFAARCRARVVCGPANNSLASPATEPALRKRRIVFVPDTLAGAGALIAGALFHLDGVRDAGPAIDAIGPRVARFLLQVDRSGLLPSEVASRMALRRLKAASSPARGRSRGRPRRG